MTNKTALTDDAIHKLIVDFEIECDCGIETYPVDNIVPFARAIEQAVLQSTEIQALRKDAERYRYIKKGDLQISGEELDDLIDSEMEQKT